MLRLLVLLILAPALVSAQPADWTREFPRADFSRSTVDLSEIVSGGPPRDGIPALDDPAFGPGASGLDPREPVVTLALPGESARAYPVRYLLWHEIANDRIGEVPVAVTYCPLCNAFLAFDRRVDGKVLRFGVTGRLRNSDMIMYDRETESWWQQATGEGIAGVHAGARLRALPAWMEPLSAFLAREPGGLVMQAPAAARPYGSNPYRGYDTSGDPFLYRGEDPPHGIPPLARVVAVGDRAWPLERVRRAGTIREAGLEIAWEAGLASPLDAGRLAEGRDVGFVRVRDAAGADVVHDVPFAFAFHAFHPDGTWMLD
ncbi:DUF3179 domain-containing protein [Jannaschia sp. W003]|uniref:DUF3179 domain-containing protein n=1 Tax=Jannaschia sp. W003 TaxID=2867012 RepID=UPI0021A82017|nr:DUF3179 domain-containing protein [Jannaschia sp. W003]UWQ20420.1 DUF3179 domain-containing protein [Jannaschia sp. W003]